jgi:prevent-host-death family protein
MSTEVIPVRELNQHTSAVLKRVQTGEELLVSVNGKPVARLVPLNQTDDYFLELERQGRAVMATDSSPFPPPASVGDPAVSVADLYARQREDEEPW